MAVCLAPETQVADSRRTLGNRRSASFSSLPETTFGWPKEDKDMFDDLDDMNLMVS